MTQKIWTWAAAVGLAILLGLVFARCGRTDDRTLIIVFIERIGHLVEERDTDGLVSLLDEDYRDFERRDKAQTEQLIKAYFQDSRGIVMHILETRIAEMKSGEAKVQTEIVLSSGAAKVFRKLFRALGDFYRFDLKLHKIGDQWRIDYAKWQNLGFSDLSPESRSRLQKIFPGI